MKSKDTDTIMMKNIKCHPTDITHSVLSANPIFLIDFSN